MSIYDLGCGCGRTAQALQRAGWRGRYIGADIVAEFVSELKRKCPGFEAHVHRRPSIVAGDSSLDIIFHWSVFTHIALEEPEAHLHPKVASRLAHWLVSLAMSNRRLLVETHSDHLVRRLRGLAARAGRGSELETWLLANVIVLSVEQDDGRSTVTASRLTAEGGVGEIWPADFMDEATDEESAIYYAKLDKDESQESIASQVEMIAGEEPESDEAP